MTGCSVSGRLFLNLKDSWLSFNRCVEPSESEQGAKHAERAH